MCSRVVRRRWRTRLQRETSQRHKPQFDLAESVVDVIVSLQTGTKRKLAVTRTNNEQQINTLQDVAHQSQFASRVSAVTKFDPGVEDHRLQSQASSEASRISLVMKARAGASEDPSAPVKDLITDFINRLQAQVSSEANHKPHRDEELKDVVEKKADPDTQVTTHSSELDTAISTCSVPDGEVAKLHVDLGALSAQLMTGRDACR